MKQTYITTQILITVLSKASNKNKLVNAKIRIPKVSEAIKNQLSDVHEVLNRLN